MRHGAWLPDRHRPFDTIESLKRAILRGVFDPVHDGHIEVARQALEQRGLDEVLFLIEPGVATGASVEERCRMLELACAEEPRFICSTEHPEEHEPAEWLDVSEAETFSSRLREMLGHGHVYGVADAVALHILEQGLYGIAKAGVPTLETDRLVLRGIRPRDREFLVALDTDPEVMRYIHDGAMTSEEAEKWALHQILYAASRSRYGKWIAERRLDGAAVGWVELGKHGGWWRDDTQVGYQFAPEFHGQGYAREAVKRLVRFAFERLRRDRVVAVVRPANVRSSHLLEVLRFQKNKRHPREKRDGHDFYVVTRRRFSSRYRRGR